jgi:hypothetical protein
MEEERLKMSERICQGEYLNLREVVLLYDIEN